MPLTDYSELYYCMFVHFIAVMICIRGINAKNQTIGKISVIMLAILFPLGIYSIKKRLDEKKSA